MKILFEVSIILLLPLLLLSCKGGAYEGEIPDSIVLSPEEAYVIKGSYQGFVAMAYFEDGSVEDLTGWVEWSSSNTDVAELSDEPGRFLAKGEGSTYIVASLLGVSSDPTPLIVTSGNREDLVAIRVEAGDAEVDLGRATGFTALGIYGDLSTADITYQVEWKSLDPDIITIISTGDAVGIGEGYGEVKAYMGDIGSEASGITVIDTGEPAILFDPNPAGAQGEYTVISVRLRNFTVPTSEDVYLAFDPNEVLYYAGYIIAEDEIELYLLMGITAEPVIEFKVYYGSGASAESAEGDFLVERYEPIPVESGDTITGVIEDEMGYAVYAMALEEGENGWTEFSSDYLYPYLMIFGPDGLTLIADAIYAAGFEAGETGTHYVWMMDYYSGGGSYYDYSAYFEFPSPDPSIRVTEDPAGEEGSFMIIPVEVDYMNLWSLEGVTFDDPGIVYYSFSSYDYSSGEVWAVAGPELPEYAAMTLEAGGQTAAADIHISDREPISVDFGSNAAEGAIEVDYETDFYSLISPEGFMVTVDAKATAFTPYLFVLKDEGSLIAAAGTYGASFPTLFEGSHYILVLNAYLTGDPTYTYTLDISRDYIGTPFLSTDDFPIEIPDDSPGYPEPGTPAYSEIVVSDVPEEILHFYVWTYISHGWTTDISITLTSPAGTEMNLSDYSGNGIGYSALWGYDTEPDDEMTFNDLLVHGVNGTWILTAVDNFPADSGNIEGWAIIIDY